MTYFGECLFFILLFSLRDIYHECNKLDYSLKGERTLDLLGTPMSLKSSILNGIISRFWQIGTIIYWLCNASLSLQMWWSRHNKLLCFLEKIPFKLEDFSDMDVPQKSNVPSPFCDLTWSFHNSHKKCFKRFLAFLYTFPIFSLIIIISLSRKCLI